MTQDQTPRIYCACLSAYNNGKLYGRWIDCDQDADDIWIEINEMLAASPEPDAEEWAVHDFEGWHGLTISEYPDVEEICTWAELIVEHGAAIAKFIGWAKDVGITADADEFQARYCGHWESSQKFALESDEIEEHYQYKELSQKYPVWANCIDWEHFANELELMDAYQYIDAKPSKEYGIYVFRYMPE